MKIILKHLLKVFHFIKLGFLPTFATFGFFFLVLFVFIGFYAFIKYATGVQLLLGMCAMFLLCCLLNGIYQQHKTKKRV